MTIAGYELWEAAMAAGPVPLTCGAVLAKVQAATPSLVPSARRAMEVIIADPEAVIGYAAADLAARADTAASTVVRACQQAGFKGFQDLKLALVRDLALPAPDPSRVVLTNGTQSSLLLVLRHLTSPGDIVLAEGLTYGVMRQLAERARVRLLPVELDADGLLPDALDAACRDAGPALIYCNPTYQTPTTSVMSARRRVEIAAVARRHGVPIFEDDVLGALHPDAPPPLSTIAPELTWYSMGLTKALTQGLRVGYLVGPDAIIRSYRDGARHRGSALRPR